MQDQVLSTDTAGLWCADGGFHVDPSGPVPVALVTHAHSDHARPGSGVYWCAAEGESLLRRRLPPGSVVRSVPYGEAFTLGRASVSFHPAGHIRGSAMVRIEVGNSVWVVSGDYKRDPDPTCALCEPVACDVFITEATFALPIYRWAPTRGVIRALADWWRTAGEKGSAAVLFCYTLGKTQRILAELRRLGEEETGYAWIKPRRVGLHGGSVPLTAAYAADGVAMLETVAVSEEARRDKGREWPGELVIAPPSAAGSPWMRRFGSPSKIETAFVSGWMAVRGVRRRRGYDTGFVLSDHADWDGLLRTIRETGARKVITTHGSAESLARYLRENGTDAEPLAGLAGRDEERDDT